MLHLVVYLCFIWSKQLWRQRIFFLASRGYKALPYADIKDGTGNPIAQSDSLGLAQWNGTDDKQEVIVSALGYTSDTLNLFRDEYAKVILYPEVLESTVIQSRRNSRQLE